MQFARRTLLARAMSVCGALLFLVAQAGVVLAESYLSPTALVAAPDGKTLFVASAGVNQVQSVDLEGRKVLATLPMPAAPSGLALSRDASQLFVTCAAPESCICVIDVKGWKLVSRIKAGHTATAPVLSPDNKTLFVCNRFNNDVAVIDLATGKQTRRIPVLREPVAAAITPDGKFLLVANLLPQGRADVTPVSACVTVIDAATCTVLKQLPLPNGSTSLSDIQVSPDGKYAIVTHILSRYALPTTQLERGWMNTNAKTVIDLACMEILNTVLLDGVDCGAANPWGIAWSSDGSKLGIAHAGTHEISIIDFKGLIEKLGKIPAKLDKAPSPDDPYVSHVQADVPNDLAFLVGLRQRVRLSASDRGPRALAIAGSRVCAANYFSGTISVIDLADVTAVKSIALAPTKAKDLVRQGEFYFNDASICFQGWQSCATCHPGDGRVDALNWDLLNDGVGNPKNTKSLLLAHQTPPAMSMGIRDTAEVAVRSGIRYILFSAQPEEFAVAIDAYLKSLKPVPSPSLVDGNLSSAAKNGKKVFERAGCAGCHSPELFTNLHGYDVGTQGPLDKPSDRFDTPTLVELWRTGPYLHDGSAATLREVVTTRNHNDRHGKTSDLSEREIDDLCAYLLSL